jgi:hypothetical protein
MSTARTNSRKLLARLEARSLSLADSKPPRDNIGTAPDARLHAPPRTESWRKTERALALLREGTRGCAGPARIHASTPTKSLRDPDATDNIDIAGALAFAVSRPELGVSRAALRRQLAVSVYMFRNWQAFAAQHQEAMQVWTRAVVIGIHEGAKEAPWAKQARKSKHFARALLRIADAATDEFRRPDHCTACGGHGLEQTGVRVGLACVKCFGHGTVPWSSSARARAARVRKEDFLKFWSHPYLALLDRLVTLERRGAHLHTKALGDEDDG